METQYKSRLAEKGRIEIDKLQGKIEAIEKEIEYKEIEVQKFQESAERIIGNINKLRAMSDQEIRYSNNPINSCQLLGLPDDNFGDRVSFECAFDNVLENNKDNEDFARYRHNEDLDGPYKRGDFVRSIHKAIQERKLNEKEYNAIRGLVPQMKEYKWKNSIWNPDIVTQLVQWGIG